MNHEFEYQTYLLRSKVQKFRAQKQNLPCSKDLHCIFGKQNNHLNLDCELILNSEIQI